MGNSNPALSVTFQLYSKSLTENELHHNLHWLKYIIIDFAYPSSLDDIIEFCIDVLDNPIINHGFLKQHSLPNFAAGIFYSRTRE